MTALNLATAEKLSQNSDQDFLSAVTTTSHCYTWLESDHPYKPSTESHYKVTFPETVKWLTVKFTPKCGTVQPEDYLQLYILKVKINAKK